MSGTVRSLGVTSACEEGLHLWCVGRTGSKGQGRPCACDCHTFGTTATASVCSPQSPRGGKAERTNVKLAERVGAQ